MTPNTSPTDNNPQTNPSGRPPLSEQDFIQNGWSFRSFPFWLWLVLIAVIAALTWGSMGWYERFMQREKQNEPFLEVTNREFSIFLWQFPSFMRHNISKKTGYLPGFLATGENFSPGTAEQFISAPPDLIFLYHTWHRLIYPEFIARPISPEEFANFLEQLPEWKPANWVNAPVEYTQMIDSRIYATTKDLQTLTDSALPLIVRQAFQGWKNYFMEGPQINELQPTFAQVKIFLEHHPHYARNYWRNIQEVNGQQVAGSNYLYDFLIGKFIPDAIFPKEQLAPFLKVAIYNAEQAKQNR
jgi:hypothetical protein